MLALVAGASAQIAWNQSATGILAVTETIVPEAGEYRYTYDIANLADAAGIWWLVVYHDGPVTSATNVDSVANWGMGYGGAIGSDIDSPNGEASFVYSFDLSYESGNDAIALGTTATGLSFLSPIYDPSPKLFVADRKGEWVGAGTLPSTPSGDQTFTYGGTTGPVPEPASMAVLGLGLATLKRRRRSSQ